MTPSVFFSLSLFSPRIQQSEANTRLISNKIYCFDSPNGWQCLLWRLSYICSHSNIKSKHFSRFQFKCLREWFGLRVVIRRWMWDGEQIIESQQKGRTPPENGHQSFNFSLRRQYVCSSFDQSCVLAFGGDMKFKSCQSDHHIINSIKTVGSQRNWFTFAHKIGVNPRWFSYPFLTGQDFECPWYRLSSVFFGAFRLRIKRFFEVMCWCFEIVNCNICNSGVLVCF